VENIRRLLYVLMRRHMTPDESEFSGHSSDTGEAIKVAVEAQDLPDAVLSHDGQVDGISRSSRLIEEAS